LPAAVRHGAFELTPVADDPLVAGLAAPLVLSSCVDCDGPAGRVLGTVDGRPGLVLIEDGARREAWLAGMPALLHQKRELSSFVALPHANGELLRRLLVWLAGERPLARLEPFPPDDAYRRLRPADYRNVPTLDLLPLAQTAPDGAAVTSLLAIVFPYTPVAARTALVVTPPAGTRLGTVTELWCGEDWTGRVESTGTGELRLSLELPGDLELLAIQVEFVAAADAGGP